MSATTPSRKPSLRVERALHRQGHRLVAGMDEVGRGALAGPVTVGVVVVEATSRSAPVGLRDSKLLTPRARESLVGPVRRWAHAVGVGSAGADEIDAVGIMAALRLAGRRALEDARVRPDVLVLDGNHDWLTDPWADGLLGLCEPVDAWSGVPVRTLVKADRTCSSVAAASVVAKVARDARMVAEAGEHPAYGWHLNKGYAAPEHRAALLREGPCELHRRSWHLTRPMGEPPGPGRCDEPLHGWSMMGDVVETKVRAR